MAQEGTVSAPPGHDDDAERKPTASPRRWLHWVLFAAVVGPLGTYMAVDLMQLREAQRQAALQFELDDYYRLNPDKAPKPCPPASAEAVIDTCRNAPVLPSTWALSEQRLKRQDAAAGR